MEYALEILCNGKEVADLEKVHLSYIKSKLKIKTSSSFFAIYAECGRFPLLIKQKLHTLKEDYRYGQLPHSKESIQLHD